MAEGISASAHFLSALLLVFSLLSPGLCRTAPRTLQTTTLDVSASLEKTLAILSVDRRASDGGATAEASSFDASTVSLHSRDLLKGSAEHEDYRALTLARLARDSARAEALATKLNVAVKGIRKSDLTPLQTEDLEGPVSYGDGSYTVGDFVTETVTFGGSGAGVDNIAIGCGHDNEGLFVGAAGLLGLGGGSLSFPSQIKATGFSYCLVDRDSTSSSTLQLGSGPSAGSVTAPMLRNRKFDTFYYLGMTGISVGGRLLSIPPSSFAVDESGNGGVIVDCGTAVTRLQSEVYNSLRDAFVSGTGSLPSASGVALFDTCYDLSSMSSVEVPTVSLHFPEGKKLQLPAKNYLIPVDSSGTFCFAFAPTSSPLSIIGNVQQQGTRVTFDVANSVVAFEPNKC
ncbi:hypothetical protein H6P81_009534 [Aristolochia fimbriata]|uniref:Peptidase A1 domain-containing protein n=1 Tax=Aristolochia fimbriata TaxID=158543 RepID=A0AAV7ELP9_ARIFI|nr:hypothetical protein H6P81_009534 [Aristolochia fimbriata]